MENIISQNQDSFICNNKIVSILGINYKILYKNYTDDSEFKDGSAGFCNMLLKEIVICSLDSYPEPSNLTEKEKELTYKSILRHEIIHAYMYESGLDNESHSPSSWAVSEEIIDWIAIQSQKIFKTFNELGVLDNGI